MQQQVTLRNLDALLGEWTMEALVQGQSMGIARSTFAWLEGGAFLVQHVEADPTAPAPPSEWAANSPLPTVAVIGLDDTTEQFCMLYADARGVQRIYEMSLGDGVWKIWREAPGFHQRFTGSFSDDAETVTARWEASQDGSSWRPDFDVIYTKVT